MPAPDVLHEVLSGLRERGSIGTTSVDEAVAHAERFVALLPDTPLSLADLGSGGGLPGLVIAVRRPAARVVLVERRLTRADQLRRAVGALSLGERVEVHAGDVRAVAEARPRSFDVVTARSFGPPAVTARWGAALLIAGGVLLVSEPPEAGDGRWTTSVLDSVGLVDEGATAGIRSLRRR
ncbi:MAG: RsmG family class I SAM-dependent methyltransferase [Ilumatobacteraceae bacterium]